MKLKRFDDLFDDPIVSEDPSKKSKKDKKQNRLTHHNMLKLYKFYVKLPDEVWNPSA